MYQSEKNRTTIRIHWSHKALFDEIFAEERQTRINLMDEVIEFYAKEKHPNLYNDFLEGNLKLQAKLRNERKI